MTPQGNDFPKANFLPQRKGGAWGICLGLTVASALIFAATFHYWLSRGAVPVFFSIVLLLHLLRGRNSLDALVIGTVWGAMAFGMSLSQVWGLLDARALVAGILILMTLFVNFAPMQNYAEQRGIKGWRWLGFTMVNWTGFEVLRAIFFPAKIPWMTLGVACGPNALLPWIGVHGMSALVVLLAAFAVSRETVVGKLLWIVAEGFFLDWLCSPKMPEAIDPARAVKVALVQNQGEQTWRYESQTASLAGDVQLIVWPEYADFQEGQSNQRNLSALQQICMARQAVMVVGSLTVPADKKQWFNTAIILDPKGGLDGHCKVLFENFHHYEMDGDARLPVKTSLAVVGVPMRHDADYEGIMRSMTAAGAEFFAVPGIDAVAWTGGQQRQHAALFRIRACENARWVAVCTASGVSEIIDPQGILETSSLPALTTGEVVGLLNRETRLTFFTRLGWLTPWIVLAVALACWIMVVPKRRKRR